MEGKERRFDLSFTCGMMGFDYDGMDFKDYTSLELHNMYAQMNNAMLEITTELRIRKYRQDEVG